MNTWRGVGRITQSSRVGRPSERQEVVFGNGKTARTRHRARHRRRIRSRKCREISRPQGWAAPAETGTLRGWQYGGLRTGQGDSRARLDAEPAYGVESRSYLMTPYAREECGLNRSSRAGRILGANEEHVQQTSNKRVPMNKHCFVVSLSTVLLAACGGGGGDRNDVFSPPTQQEIVSELPIPPANFPAPPAPPPPPDTMRVVSQIQVRFGYPALAELSCQGSLNQPSTG